MCVISKISVGWHGAYAEYIAVLAVSWICYYRPACPTSYICTYNKNASSKNSKRNANSLWISLDRLGI